MNLGNELSRGQLIQGFSLHLLGNFKGMEMPKKADLGWGFHKLRSLCNPEKCLAGFDGNRTSRGMEDEGFLPFSELQELVVEQLFCTPGNVCLPDITLFSPRRPKVEAVILLGK